MSKNQLSRRGSACFIGFAVMLILSVVIVLLLPICILNEYLPAEYTYTFIIISMGFIGFLGSGIACLMPTKQSWRTGVLAVGAYDVLLTAIAVLFFDGLNMHILYSIFAGASGCALAILVLLIHEKSSRKRRKRRGNR